MAPLLLQVCKRPCLWWIFTSPWFSNCVCPWSSNFSFDPDQPFGVPSPSDLLSKVKGWLVGEVSSGEAYLSAFHEGEELDGDVLEEGDLNRDVLRANGAPDPETPQSQRRKERRTPVCGPERLAPESQQVLESNQGMSSQLQSLSQRQHALPSQSSLHPCSALRQPISVSLGQPLNQPQAIAKTLGTPPSNCSSGSSWSVAVSFHPYLLELESEKLQPAQSTSSDPLARAVMVQAQALTELVGQIASQSSDPMMDLVGTGGGAGTRGAVGRAKLQAELAQQKGLFFNSVLMQMARRMQPTQPAAETPAELLARGVSGTQYLERYGGYGKHRDLGALQYQVLTIMTSCKRAIGMLQKMVWHFSQWLSIKHAWTKEGSTLPTCFAWQKIRRRVCSHTAQQVWCPGAGHFRL